MGLSGSTAWAEPGFELVHEDGGGFTSRTAMPSDFSGKFEFDILTPTTTGALSDNIKSALARGLPEADGAPLKRLTIVANGPSARGVVFEGDTLALNGALKLFTDRGQAPTYWAACDPQPLVADFLRDAPPETTYLVASKCDPLVFDMLSDRDVRVWHIDDVAPAPGLRAVPCAVSVTLCAMMLAHRLGYRSIDLWGWDCCFGADGSHHAATGALGITPQRVEVIVGDPDTGRRFWTNPTWACEANDAAGVLPVLRWCGVDIRIHGGGMIAAIIEEFAAEPLFKAA